MQVALIDSVQLGLVYIVHYFIFDLVHLELISRVHYRELVGHLLSDVFIARLSKLEHGLGDARQLVMV